MTNEGTIKATSSASGSGKAGILLKAGTVTNSGATSLISGAKDGVYINAAAGFVTNQGTITAGRNGVRLDAGGSINNSGSIYGHGIGALLIAGGTVSNTGTIRSGYTGIYLTAGGTVSNSGSINGTLYGIQLAAGGNVVNSGTINGDGIGIYANAGGTVSNSGSINSNNGTGVYIAGGSVNNSGTITSAYRGVAVYSGGTLTNTGSINSSNGGGVYIAGGSVNNSGTITAGYRGVVLYSGGTLTNTGLITGTTYGAYVWGGTVINFGTITSLGTNAVQFYGSGGQLILGTGSKLNGAINGGSYINNSIKLTGTGTMANTITNFGAGSSLTVQAGANWVASGTWAIPTITNSGTLQPGVSGTPLNVTGNFVQTSTGVLKTVLTSSGGASLLNITGNATLAGSVAVTAPASITAGTQKYTILTASGAVSGTFSSVSGGTALLVPSLSYDAKNAFVTLTQQAVATPAKTDPTKASTTQTQNENNFAKAFDAAYAANPALFTPILASLNQIKSQADLNNALNQLTGENAAAVTNMIQAQVNDFLNQFQQHSQGTMGVTEVDDPWITGFVQSGSFRGNNNANQITETAWGVTAGADHVVSPGFRVGVMGGMGQQRSNTRGAGSARVWYEQLAATADYADGNWYLNGLIGFSFNHGSTMRAISLPGLTATALGHLTSTQVLASGQAGYGIPLDAKFTLVPFLGVDISVTNQDAYAETGAGLLNLSFAGRTINNQRSILGARLKGAEVDVLGLPLNTELKLGWAHQFAAVNPASVAAFASVAGPTFTVTGAPMARNAGVIGLGIATAVASNASIHLRYDGEFSGISSSNTLSFGLAVDW